MQPFQSRATELSVQDGCILRGSRVVVPKQGRQAVATLLHEGHPGITRMKRLARGYVICRIKYISELGVNRLDYNTEPVIIY